MQFVFILRGARMKDEGGKERNNFPDAVWLLTSPTVGGRSRLKANCLDCRHCWRCFVRIPWRKRFNPAVRAYDVTRFISVAPTTSIFKPNEIARLLEVGRMKTCESIIDVTINFKLPAIIYGARRARRFHYNQKVHLR